MVTLFIIALTAVISYLGFQNPRLIDKLIFWPPAIKQGKEYYRFVSHGLIHADFQHLLFNMFTLYFFGRYFESFLATRVGPIGYLVFYAIAIVVAIIPTYYKNIDNKNYRSLGASGAVSAVLFAFILLNPWSLIFVFFIPCPAIVYGIAYTAWTIWSSKKNNDNINHSAHLWGAAYGIIVTIAIDPELIGKFFEKLLNPPF